MERLCSIVRSRFRRHWRTVACQIKAVIANDNPKRAFLYDCGAADVPALVNFIAELKEEKLIDKDISIVTVQEDIFILNLGKFKIESSHVIVDASGSLKKPQIIEDTKLIDAMFQDINKQLQDEQDEDAIALDIKPDWCIPTIFGYLINYPILYYHDNDKNCLSLIDLLVYQIMFGSETLISFSVPNEIYEESQIIRDKISEWIEHFQKHEDITIKSFVANYPTVIL